MRGSVRPSPALIVALIALVAALAGSAVALPGKNKVDKNDIKRNAVKGKQVLDDSLTGADVDESTLGQVPSAATAGSATSAGDVSGLTRVPRTVVTENTSPDPTLATIGPFTIAINCNDEGGTTGYLEIRTSENDSIFKSGFSQHRDLDPGETGIIVDQNDADDALPTQAPPDSTEFAALAPGGAAIDASLNLAVNGAPGLNGTCTIWGYIVRSG